MSASLLRKGLELLETAGVSDSSQRSASAARPNNLLKKKKNKSSRSKRGKATIKGRIIKSALVEDYPTGRKSRTTQPVVSRGLSLPRSATHAWCRPLRQPRRSWQAAETEQADHRLGHQLAQPKGEEYQKHQAADHFKKNMQYMMGTHCVADSTTTEKILTQNRGRKAKDRPVEKVKKKPEGTVFTEEDFQRFEREYFGRAGTI